MRSDMD